MIGKVVRGANVGGLPRYLYGPGRANEHTYPHLVAVFGDPEELEPDRRADGSPELRRLTGSAAMRYQYAADDRDAAIANALSEFAGAPVVQLRPRRRAGTA
jgi:hypothetical protein